MKVQPIARASLVFSALLAASMLQPSCARAVEDEQPAAVVFAPGTSPSDVCIETKCPAPFATCPGAGAPCTVNLNDDVDHCGACGTPCPSAMGKHGHWLCSEGQCRLACAPMYADCNGSTTDGCETSTSSDPANCGACGNTCKEGVICWLGACGCPSGFTQCGSDCKKLDSDDDNCAACGMRCQAPESPTDPRWSCGANVTPAHTKWTCASSACTLQCKPPFADCDDNFCGNGCETNLSSDPANCGACGKACAPGEFCRDGACLCPPGTTNCGGDCVDLQTDIANCGACNKWCPGQTSVDPGDVSTGSPKCEGGTCSYVCFPGFADCDGHLSNGCEANLATDQKHCGSCTTHCDVKGGQPCVGGTCLTKPCERPAVQ